jgi:hypothetical protein
MRLSTLSCSPPWVRLKARLDQIVGRSTPVETARTEKVGAVSPLHVIAYNLMRLGNLLRPAMAPA